MKYCKSYFNYIDVLKVPEWVVDSCPQTGDVTNSIAEFMEDKDVKRELCKIDPESLKKELSEYGAWNEDELNNHEDNLMRILWIAIGDIWDERIIN